MEERKGYTMNKGINKPVEFRGLKAQYIGRLVMAVVGVLGGYAVLHLAGVNDYMGLLLTLGLGGFLVKRLYRMSNRYGQYGLMKRKAGKRVPRGLRCGSGGLFNQIYGDGVRKIR